ncbi:hypothetical protein GQX74_009961 [Glossina fuscipes]|nr:hypothetical protein GQX74_009961 [Glossina fuscipes]
MFHIITVFLLLLRLQSKLIFDIYPDKGIFYELKYLIAKVLLKHLRYKFYYKNESALNSPQSFEVHDQPQVLDEHPKSYDVISFMAANINGQKLLINLERRRRGIMKACFYLWLPEYGLLALPKLPDMLHFTTDGNTESEEFKGIGFHIYPEEPMIRWRIKYEGLLKQLDEGNKLLQVKLNLTFNSTGKYFNYNRDLSLAVIADSLAREAWNEGFYTMLKNVDKVLQKRLHYEQNGQLTGSLEIYEKIDKLFGHIPLTLSGFRDHSFGTERCLSTINRYVYVALFLEDGSSMVVGILSQPSFFLSSLKVGYICSKDGDYKPITACNFELYSYGEKGTPPRHQNFIVYTVDKDYFVQIKVQDSTERYAGGNWEAKIYNQFVACCINGRHGHGITEYLYRHKGGRPEEASYSDPEWYKRVRKSEDDIEDFDHNELNSFSPLVLEKNLKNTQTTVIRYSATPFPFFLSSTPLSNIKIFTPTQS